MKNIFYAFNDVNIDLKEYDDTSLSDTEIKKIKERVSKKLNKKKEHRYSWAAAVLAVFVIYATLFNNGIVMANIAGITTNLKAYFFKSINRNFGDYITPIGRKATDKNISITLQQVIIDNGQIIISSTFDFSKLTEKDKLLFKNKNKYLQMDNVEANIKVNGETIKSGGGEIKTISKDVINFICVYSFNKLDVSKPSDIKIEYNFYDSEPVTGNKDLYADKRIDGNWNFDLFVRDNNINKTLKKLTLNKNNMIKMPDGNIIKISEVSKSDISFRVSYDVISQNGEQDTNVKDNIKSIQSDFIVTEATGERHEYGGFFGLEGTKGYNQYFIKNMDNNKFTIEVEGGKGSVSVDFSN